MNEKRSFPGPFKPGGSELDELYLVYWLADPVDDLDGLFLANVRASSAGDAFDGVVPVDLGLPVDLDAVCGTGLRAQTAQDTFVPIEDQDPTVPGWGLEVAERVLDGRWLLEQVTQRI